MTARFLVSFAVTAWISLVAAQSASPPAPPMAAPTTPPATQPAAEQPTMGDDKDTIQASQKWLALLDAGKAGAAWDASSAHLKSVVSRPKWIEGITAARKPFGRLETRRAEKFARSHQLPGAPEGDYSIIEFDSAFANGKKASEQVIWMLEKGDVWRVSGYFIR